MKKLLFLIGIVCCFTVQAQFSSAIVEDLTFPSYATYPYTAVRNWTTTEVIGCRYSPNGSSFFYKDNSTLNYNHVYLPDDIHPYDLRINGDLVFFCGFKDLGGIAPYFVGIIGVFDANELKTAPVNTVHYTYQEINGTTELTRLASYGDPYSGDDHIVAIGGDGNATCPYGWTCSRAVDCVGLMPGATSVMYAVRPAYNSAPDIDGWHDVVVTDNYVVLVGYGNMSGQMGLVLRRCDKVDPLNGSMDNIYFYPFAPSLSANCIWATTLTDDNIAVTYPWIGKDGKTGYSHVRIFDISLMMNTLTQVHTVPFKNEINEIAYLPLKKQIVNLERFQLASGITTSNYVMYDPNATVYPYTSTYMYDTNYYYKSVTNLDGNYFVGMADLVFLMRDATVSLPAYTNISYLVVPPSECPFSDSIKINLDENIEPKVYFDPGGAVLATFPTIFDNNPNILGYTNPYCISN